MINIISTITVIACLFNASAEIAEHAVIVPEQVESNNITFVGFDGYFDCDAVMDILNKNTDDYLQFVVVNSKVTQKGLLNIFLTRLKQLHRFSRAHFRQIQEHWANIFSAPVHIFVFCDGDHPKEEMKETFGYSDLCCDMVAKSLELGRGFFWMGAMGIIEEQVKNFLNVPKDCHLVATIFFGDQESQEKEEISAK